MQDLIVFSMINHKWDACFNHYYKMWVEFTSPCSLNQWIHYFFISPHPLQLVNSLKIQWNHLACKGTFCCNEHNLHVYQGVSKVQWNVPPLKHAHILELSFIHELPTMAPHAWNMNLFQRLSFGHAPSPWSLCPWHLPCSLDASQHRIYLSLCHFWGRVNSRWYSFFVE
jgi:hypothetical protein